MAGPTKGRNITLTWNGTAFNGVREKTLTLNGEPINVTSDENNGWQILLSEVAETSIEIGISGISKSPVMKNDWFAGNRTRAVVLTFPDGSIVSGQFMLTAYNEGMPYNDAATFEATLSSAAQPTYTPGS